MTIDRSKFQMRERAMPDHMANLDKLTPASLRGARMAVLEIADAVQVDARRGERNGQAILEPAVVLRFKELPKRVYWVNKMGVNILCDVYGDDESDWIGKRVPLVVKEGVKNPQTRQSQDMLWVANADEWESLFAEWENVVSAKSPDAAKTAANAAAAKARAAAEKRSGKANPTPSA